MWDIKVWKYEKLIRWKKEIKRERKRDKRETKNRLP